MSYVKYPWIKFLIFQIQGKDIDDFFSSFRFSTLLFGFTFASFIHRDLLPSIAFRIFRSFFRSP